MIRRKMSDFVAQTCVKQDSVATKTMRLSKVTFGDVLEFSGIADFVVSVRVKQQCVSSREVTKGLKQPSILA